MQITKVRIPESKYSTKCPFEMKPEGITIHNTANDASAMSEVSYMIGNNKQVSFHEAADDYRVVQGIPHNRNSWNSGDGNGFGNRKTIAIEICYSKSGGERFDKAERNGAKRVAQILKEYNWGIDKVGKHQDRSGKYCPHKTLDLGWGRFLNLIRAELGEEIRIENTTIQQPVVNAKTNVKYQVFANNRWYNDIVNYNEQNDMGYAGIFRTSNKRFKREYCTEMKQM